MFHVRRFSLPLPHEALQVPDIKTEPTTKQVKNYLLLKKIGKGASSKVFLGLNIDDNHFYALKAIKTYGNNSLTSSSSATTTTAAAAAAAAAATTITTASVSQTPYLSQFEREISLIRRLKHPSIIEMIEVLHAPLINSAYIILEWADCGSLRNAVSSQFSFSDDQLASIFGQVLCGLHYLHEQGIAHQDIKPSNLLIFSDGTAKISDFGVGHSFESADTVVGTPAYQAPEIFDDSSDSIIDPSKEDVWSLGVSLFEAKFGRLPFLGENFYEIANEIFSNGLTIPEEASPLLRDVLTKMLDTDTERRISVTELLEHPFFDGANRKKAPLGLPVIETEGIEPVMPIRQIDAVECDDDYSFLVPNNASYALVGKQTPSS